MKNALSIIGVIFAIWFGFDQLMNNKGQDIKDTERRNRDIEKEQLRKDEERERAYSLKVAELEKKFANQDIKEVVNETKDEFSEEIELQKQELNSLRTENSYLSEEVSEKTDSIKHLIEEKEQLLTRIQHQEDIIAQKDSLISFYKSELESLKSKSREIIELLKEATTLEIEGDNLSSFWSKKNKQSNYYSAWLIYKKLWKNYGLVSAEDSFHSTWKKLQALGVELEP